MQVRCRFRRFAHLTPARLHPPSPSLSSCSPASNYLTPCSVPPSSFHQTSLSTQSLKHNITLCLAGGLRHRSSTSSAKPNFTTCPRQPVSLPYAAPELLISQTTTPLLPHPAQDIWALGLLLFALLTGRLPFSDSFEPRLQMKIINGEQELE